MQLDPKPDALELHINGDTVIVRGEIDVATAPLLVDAIAQIEAGPVVLDLEAVRFIDSSGVGAIVSAYQDLAAAGRTLSILRRSAVVERVFAVSGVDAILGH